MNVAMLMQVLAQFPQDAMVWTVGGSNEFGDWSKLMVAGEAALEDEWEADE